MWIFFSFPLLHAPLKGWSSLNVVVISCMKSRHNSVLYACPIIHSSKCLHERPCWAREGHAKKTFRGLALLQATGQAEKQLSAKPPLWRWLYYMTDIFPVWKSQAVSVTGVLVSLLWGWAMQLCCVQENKEQSLSNSLSLPCNATGFRLSVCNSSIEQIIAGKMVFSFGYQKVKDEWPNYKTEFCFVPLSSGSPTSGLKFVMWEDVLHLEDLLLAE